MAFLMLSRKHALFDDLLKTKLPSKEGHLLFSSSFFFYFYANNLFRLIGERVGHAARLHQQNAPESSAGLTACSQDGAGYLANSNRFHTDTCGEEFALRQGGIERRRQVDELKREIAVSREEARWQQMEEEKVLLPPHYLSLYFIYLSFLYFIYKLITVGLNFLLHSSVYIFLGYTVICLSYRRFFICSLFHSLLALEA